MFENNDISDSKDIIYLCATNKLCNFYNEKYYKENINKEMSFTTSIRIYNDKEINKDEYNDNEINKKLHFIAYDKKMSNNEKIEKMTKEISNFFNINIKKDMNIMITKNINNYLKNGSRVKVKDFMYNNITFYDDDNKYNNSKIETININIKISSFNISYNYLPIVQCNAITIHKCQGLTLENNTILNCEGIFANNMFYVGISRIKHPKNLKIINFEKKHLKMNIENLDFDLNKNEEIKEFIIKEKYEKSNEELIKEMKEKNDNRLKDIFKQKDDNQPIKDFMAEFRNREKNEIKEDDFIEYIDHSEKIDNEFLNEIWNKKVNFGKYKDIIEY